MNLAQLIAINLGIMLIASWVFGGLIIARLLKERDDSSDKTSSNQKKDKNQQTNPTNADEDEPAPTNLLGAMNNLSNNLLEKEKHIGQLSKIQQEQKALLKEHKIEDAFSEQQQASEKIISKLQSELSESRQALDAMEQTLRQGYDKDSRIAILEETEDRLRERITNLKQQGEQVSQLAEGLQKSKKQNQGLQAENTQLRKNLKELSNASEKQLETIRKMNRELEQVSQLESHQRKIINELEKKLSQEKSGDNDHAQIEKLENDLKRTTETLKRTLREKDFIEMHLLEMDKALSNTEAMEEKLKESQQKREAIEDETPDYPPEQKPTTALPTVEVNASTDPELHALVENSRLFGTLEEYWMTLDTPPLRIISQNQCERPNNIKQWVKTSINNNEYNLVIGMSQKLNERLSKAIENSTEDSADGGLTESLSQLSNILAEKISQEMANTPEIEPPEIINNIEPILEGYALVSEVLVEANEQPLLMQLIKAA